MSRELTEAHACFGRSGGGSGSVEQEEGAHIPFWFALLGQRSLLWEQESQGEGVKGINPQQVLCTHSGRLWALAEHGFGSLNAGLLYLKGHQVLTALWVTS